MKNYNLGITLMAFTASILTACGGGIGSNAGTSGVTASVTGVEPIATPHSYAVPLASVGYQNVRYLAGTGAGMTLSPTDLHTHYSYPTTTLNGAGQTIAIVDAPGTITPAGIIADLNALSKYYNLPQQTSTNNFFKQIDLSNGVKSVQNAGWNNEVSLDVQWAHAMAPAANIVLVTAKSGLMTDMTAAVQTAAAQPGVVAVSLSWGAVEYAAETTAAFDGVMASIQAQGIVVFASTGDSGNNGGNQEWPAASPYVTGVGGTSIKTVGYSLPNIATEVAWTYGGGGASLLEAIPAWQKTALAGNATLTLDPTKRALPDIAYNSDPNYSPVAIVVGGNWYAEGGTSAGAPQWAAIVALIAQDRATKNESTLAALVKATVGGFNGLLYQSKYDATGVFDVTAGTDNTSVKACALCTAGKGYDAVTGLGVPNVNNLLTAF